MYNILIALRNQNRSIGVIKLCFIFASLLAYGNWQHVWLWSRRAQSILVANYKTVLNGGIFFYNLFLILNIKILNNLINNIF